MKFISQEFLLDPAGSMNDTLAPITQKILGYQGVTLDEVGNPDELYFVIFQETLDEYNEIGMKHPAVESFLEKYDQNVVIDKISDILIFLFSHLP